MLIVTDSRGITYGLAGGNAEAEAAMLRGYVKAAETMWVSTYSARIDVLRDATPVHTAIAEATAAGTPLTADAVAALASADPA